MCLAIDNSPYQNRRGFDYSSVPPAMHKLMSWLAVWEAKEARRMAGWGDFERQHNKPTRYVFNWRNGEIDERSSYVGPSRE
ncbi:MAG: hypothetical protein M3220_17855 [Chloroflexota bacterium]|nr:hypothetical protein [Chloroflexota bacterium]